MHPYHFSLCRQAVKIYFDFVVFIPTWNLCLRVTHINLQTKFIIYTKMIAPLAARFQGMFDNIVDFIPSKFHVNLWSFENNNSVKGLF